MSELAYQQLANTSNRLFVVVAGNIGSGKTTLTKKLSEQLGWKPHFELANGWFIGWWNSLGCFRR